MNLILTFLLIFAVALKLFPPKKPNFLYGYQLGSAKKSLRHWQLANSVASTYLIILYATALAMSLIFDYYKNDEKLWVLALLLIGSFVTYFGMEQKLKNLNGIER